MDNIKRKKLILEGNMYKVLITLSVPIMINNLIQTLYNLIDGIWVSKIGSVQFAATSFVWPVLFLFISLGIGISIAGTSILAQLIGAGKEKEANRYANQIIMLSILVSVFFAIIGYALTPIIIKIMGATGELQKYSISFLKISFLGTPFIFLTNNFNSIMNAQGNTVTPTVLGALSAILNSILDPIFIFSFNLGIEGAAIATVISQVTLSIVIVYIVNKSNSLIKPSLKKFRLNKKMINKILNIALPLSIGQSGSAIGFIVLNSFIASYGTVTIAAFGMVNRITSLIMQPAMGVGAALTTIVGQNLGINQIERVKESFIKAIKFTVLFSFVGLIIMIWKDDEIIGFFMQAKDDTEVITQGITYLKYIAFSMPLMGIFSVLQGVFQGSGHTKYSMNMEIGRLWIIRLPMILVFKYLTNINEEGIWFAMSFSNLIICLYGYVVYKKAKWQNKIIKTDVEKIAIN